MEQEMVEIPNAIQLALREDSAFANPMDRQSDESKPTRRQSAQMAGRRFSSGTSPLRGNDKSLANSKAAPSNDERTEKAHLAPVIPTNIDHSTKVTSSILARDSKDSVEAKTSTRPKLQPVPLPKWQPPNTPALRTEHLSNNQRRPSGPATPFPDSQPAQRQASEIVPATLAPASGNSRLPPPSILPVFGVEKSPARNYSPQYVPPPQVSTSGADALDRQPPALAMPPPPRPASDLSSTPSTSTSWRPS